MLPGMNPKQMQQVMKKMGMKQEEIPATEVIIKTPEKDIIIKDPQVSKINMMGQDSYQVSGSEEVQEKDTTPDVTPEDISTIREQTGCTQDEAIEALVEADYDLAQAILHLQQG